MNLERKYNKMLREYEDCLKQRDFVEHTIKQLSKHIDMTRKQIRARVESTNKYGSRSAVLRYKGRKLNVRKNSREAIVFENGVEIARVDNVYEAEYLFATGNL